MLANATQGSKMISHKVLRKTVHSRLVVAGTINSHDMISDLLLYRMFVAIRQVLESLSQCVAAKTMSSSNTAMIEHVAMKGVSIHDGGRAHAWISPETRFSGDNP